jgi:hypothetical protein
MKCRVEVYRTQRVEQMSSMYIDVGEGETEEEIEARVLAILESGDSPELEWETTDCDTTEFTTGSAVEYDQNDENN